MIRRLNAKHFEGIDQAELELGRITLLYGANGAGKSSLRDAIEHALTGEPCRGGVLADVIRQGSKSAEVEVVLEAKNLDGTPKPNGLSIIRRRARSGGKQMVQGVECPAGEAQAAVEHTVGASTRAITAALRAGALLELKPDELQALLAALTGATFDAPAILAAMPEGTDSAAGRAGLQLPQRFEELPSFGKAAEGARQLAKRQLAEREADLDRTPAGKPGDEPSLQAALKTLRTRREKAGQVRAHDAGARAERVRSLRAEAADLRAMPEPTAAPVPVAVPDAGEEAELARADGAAMDLDWKIGAAKAKLEQLRKDGAGGTGDDAAVLARADEITATLKRTREAHTEAKARAEALASEGKSQKALLGRIPESGCVGPCPVLPETECPLKDLSGLREKLASAVAQTRERWTNAAAAEAATSAAMRAAGVAADLLDSALARRESTARLAAVESEIEELQRQAAAEHEIRQRLQPVVDAARAAREAAKAEAKRARAAAGDYAEAQERAASLDREATALEAKAGAGVEGIEDVAEFDAQLAATEAALVGAAQAERRRTVEASVAKAKQAIDDCDAVAQACKAARVRLLAAAVGPFVGAANQALGKLAPGYAVEIDEGLELLVRKGDMSLRPAQLSDGERTRLLYVLQFAVCRLAGVRFLPLDRAELLDDAGKAALKRLIGECVGAGIQVLMLSCAAAPDAAPAGVTMYVVDGGRVRSIGRQAA